jgi:hypothetical protein
MTRGFTCHSHVPNYFVICGVFFSFLVFCFCRETRGKETISSLTKRLKDAETQILSAPAPSAAAAAAESSAALTALRAKHQSLTQTSAAQATRIAELSGALRQASTALSEQQQQFELHHAQWQQRLQSVAAEHNERLKEVSVELEREREKRVGLEQRISAYMTRSKQVLQAKNALCIELATQLKSIVSQSRAAPAPAPTTAPAAPAPAPAPAPANAHAAQPLGPAPAPAPALPSSAYEAANRLVAALADATNLSTSILPSSSAASAAPSVSGASVQSSLHSSPNRHASAQLQDTFNLSVGAGSMVSLPPKRSNKTANGGTAPPPTAAAPPTSAPAPPPPPPPPQQQQQQQQQSTLPAWTIPAAADGGPNAPVPLLPPETQAARVHSTIQELLRTLEGGAAASRS